jgi:NAD(P)-dependent dehydrogenase (short-subunit alcohol dehydrogenase family)
MMKEEDPIEDSTVIVTGAASGIGHATAEEFLRCGATVYGGDITFDKRQKDNRGLRKSPLDVRSKESFKEFADYVNKNGDGVDILVNNAGVGDPAAFEKMSDSELTEIMSVNFWGVWNGCKTLLDQIIENRGNIVNISSIAANRGGGGYTGYAASKGAILSFTKSLAAELGNHGVRVNSVSPGTIRTPRTIEHSKNMDKGKRIPYVSNRIPLNRVGKPEEVAKCVRFLGGPDSSYISGSELVVDGGRSSTDI